MIDTFVMLPEAHVKLVSELTASDQGLCYLDETCDGQIRATHLFLSMLSTDLSCHFRHLLTACITTAATCLYPKKL